jgi:hypothetical protein
MSAYDELSDEMVELLRKEVLKSERAYNYNFDDICIGAKIAMDKFKAENESLRADAERYRKFRALTLNGLDDTPDEFDAEFDSQINRSPENH